VRWCGPDSEEEKVQVHLELEQMDGISPKIERMVITLRRIRSILKVYLVLKAYLVHP
jgi:hypothetical protein